MGIDPGLRTGSKLAVVDNTGKLLASDTVHPDPKKPEAPKIDLTECALAYADNMVFDEVVLELSSESDNEEYDNDEEQPDGHVEGV